MHRSDRTRRASAALVLLALPCAVLRAQDGGDPPPPPPPPGSKAAADAAPSLVPSKWLVLPDPETAPRRPIRTDVVFARHLHARDAAPPAAGETVTGETGTPVAWEEMSADATGMFSPTGKRWACAEIRSPADQLARMDVRGAATVWVNGDARPGDVYGLGTGGFPVLLRAGVNRVYLSGLRGKVLFSVTPCAEGVEIGAEDVTCPDAVRGEPLEGWASVVVRNVSAKTVANVRLAVAGESGGENSDPFTLPPLAQTKRRVRIRAPAADAATDRISVPLVLTVDGAVAARHPIQLDVRAASGARRVTRRSDIDGSVQEWALLPVDERLAAKGPPSLVLSLHGAGVDCLGQARSYSARPDFAVACPTNRRPFGFDWQDWGRADGYETLADALRVTGIDPRRVHLTGHSMGGHGTWHFLAHDPDRFLTAVPSAGWESFDGYGNPRPRTALSKWWFGGDGGSDTLSMIRNLVQAPVFVIHGTADDNVPKSQADRMVDALTAAGAPPVTVWQEGGGHWWDDPSTPGADCVNLESAFDHFRSVTPGPAPLSLEWMIFDPAMDSRHHWLRVEQVVRYGSPATVRAAFDPSRRRAEVTTDNVRWLAVSSPDGKPLREIAVDGRQFAASREPAWFMRGDDGWLEVSGTPPAAQKSAARSGPMKRAFDRRFVLVLPTQGTPEENAEAWSRARFDAMQWWYRGNGAVTVAWDGVVTGAPREFAGRNLILYGNADTNAAWAQVVGPSSPVRVARGAVTVRDDSARVGGGTERTFRGDALAAFFVRPRADDPDALVGVLGDTGVRGARLGNLHGLFISGAGWPDYTVWSDATLTRGDDAVLAAGFFDARWETDGSGFLAK
ncbi:MAG: hypothetical protein HMLKMBBP_00210 [Planctomycetes bacterium]|nr:hypothetical protein [Planctomycetota bacterium]